MLLGIALVQIRADGVEIGHRLGVGNARFEVSQRHEDVMRAARVQPTASIHLLLIHHRNPEVGIAEQQGAVESRRCNANDRERMLIHLHHAAENIAIVLEVVVPVGVGENEIGSAVRAMLVGLVKEATEVRLHPESIEVISGGLIEPRA